MAEGSSDRPKGAGDARAERLKRALRENLKRRKTAERERTDAPEPERNGEDGNGRQERRD